MSLRPSSAPAAPSGNRILGLDLARAVAIVFVVCSHAIHVQPEGWSEGWRNLARAGSSGVAIFFALSGYLIGGQLFDGMTTGRFSLLGFWRRRWLRTMPAYFVFLLGNTILYQTFALQPEPFDWRYLLCLQNLFTLPPVFFGESWTLCIEEWFYLLMPLMLLCVRRAGLRGGRVFATAIALLCAGAIAYRCLLLWAFGSVLHARGIVFARLDALAFGVAVVVLDRLGFFTAKRLRVATIAGALAFSGWLVLMIVQGESAQTDPRRMIAEAVAVSVMPLAAALVMPALARLDRFRPRFPEPVVRCVARVSYSMYLVNIPAVWLVNLIAAHRPLGFWAALALFSGVTLAGAILSYQWIERPFIARYRRGGESSVPIGADVPPGRAVVS